MTSFPQLDPMEGLAEPKRRKTADPLAALGLPSLDELTGQAPPKKAKRKKPRLSIDEINAKGLEAIKQKRPELLEGKPWWKTAYELPLDFIDLPRNTIAQIVAGIAGVDTSKAERGSFGEKKVFMSDVLARAGVQPGAVRSILGFVGDVAIDPLTYLTAGAVTGLKVAKWVPRIGKAGERMLRGAAKTGMASDDLARALGMTAKRGNDLFRGLPKRFGREKAQKLLMSRRGGILTRQIAKNVLRGDETGKAARDLALKIGMKKQPLLRVPFTGLEAGARPGSQTAKAYQAILAAQTGGDVEKIARIGRIRKALAGATAAKDAAQAATEGKKLQLKSLTSMAYAKGGAPEDVVRVVRNLRRPAIKDIRASAKELERAKEVTAAFSNKAKVATAGSNAPGVWRLYNEARLGIAADEYGWRGMLQRIIGPRTGLLRAQELGIQSRKTHGRQQAAARTYAELQPKVDAVAASAAKDAGVSIQEARTRLFDIYHVGGEAGLTDLHPSDAMFKNWATKYAPLAARKDVQELGQEIVRRGESMYGRYTAAGGSLSKRPGYVPLVASKASKIPFEKADRQQGQREIVDAFRQSRTRLAEILDANDNPMLKDGKPWMELTSDIRMKPELRAAIKNAGGHAKTYAISAPQYEEWAAAGRFGRILGNDFPDIAAKGGTMFEHDPATALAQRAGTHESAMANLSLRNVVQRDMIALKPSDVVPDGYRAVRGLPQGHPLNMSPELRAVFSDGNTVRAYPQQVADMLERFKEAWAPGPVGKSPIRFWDKVIQAWKMQALFHPAYWTRNRVQAVMMMPLVGANPVSVYKLAGSKDVQRLVDAAGRYDTLAGSFLVDGKRIDNRLAAEFLASHNMIGGVSSVAHFAPPVLRTESALSGVGRGAGKMAQRAVNVIRNQEAKWSAREKVGLWLHFIGKGMSWQEAAEKAILALPDMSNVPSWVSAGAARAFPWARWMWNNGLNHLLVWLPTTPIWLQIPQATQRIIEGARGGNNVPGELRPDWMREQLGAQFSGNQEAGNAFLLQSWFPQEEVKNVIGTAFSPSMGARAIAGQAAPPLKFIAELATGSDIFKRRPVEDMNTAGLVKSIPVALAGKSGTPLDNLMGIRPVKEYGRRVWEQPNPTAQFTRAMLGGAMQPLNAAAGLRERDWQTREAMRKLRYKMNRALESGDQVEFAANLRQFMAYQMERKRLGLSIPKSSQKALADVR